MDRHFILVGYGDVGRRIAMVLKDAHLSFVVIDRNEEALKNAGFEYVAGDATDEKVLKTAGIQDASTVIIVLNNDADVIFATLIARNVNPHCIIMARANAVQSIDKIYRAGANYVASLSIVAGQMLARIALKHEEEETITMLEGLEIERYHITPGSSLAGKRIAETGIRAGTGCTIIGIEEEGKIMTDIDPSIVIREGMTLALIGHCEHVSKFREKYI